jgi:chromosomal replication initiation ATPase DnaA
MTYKDIQREVAAEWGMSRETMLFRGQSAGKVAARKAAMIRCRQQLGMSYPDIGRAFNLDHTTVIHHLRGISANSMPPETAHSMVAIVKRQARTIREQAAQIEFLSGQLEAWQ